MNRILEWLFFGGVLAWIAPELPLTWGGLLVLGLLIFLLQPRTE